MKSKYSFLAMGASALFLFSACNSKPGYTVQGTLSNADQQEGKTIYLIDVIAKTPIDSTVVKDSKFVFKNSVGEQTIALFSRDSQNSMPIVLSNNNSVITIDADNLAVTGDIMSEEVAKLNELINNNMSELRTIGQDIMADSELKDDAKKLKYAENEKKYSKIVENALVEAFNNNKDNAVAIYALFRGRQFLDDAKIRAMVSELGEEMQSHSYVKKLNKRFEAYDNTAAGKMFTDFEVTEEDGTIKKFSDYVGQGKYILVDFWASWCPPCRREIASIKEFYTKYVGQDFDVLGVAVWDKEADSKSAIESLQIPWQQILNTKNVATDLYGIPAIPQVMLIAPDGTIVKRDLFGDEVEKAIKEALGK